MAKHMVQYLHFRILEFPLIYTMKSLDYLVGGFNLPLWKMMEFVSWADEIPNIWKIKVMFQTTNQLYYKPLDYSIILIYWYTYIYKI